MRSRARTIHEYLLRRPIFSPAGFFSFGLLDGLSVRLRRPYLREAPVGFGLKRLATAFMSSPGSGLEFRGNRHSGGPQKPQEGNEGGLRFTAKTRTL
jgi:hypothetical protein